MEKVINRNGIRYLGISNPDRSNSSSMKVASVSTIIELKECDGLISNNVIQVKSEVKITNEKLVKTPKGVSLEGEILTGNKIFFDGFIYNNIQYSNGEENTQIYLYNDKLKFTESLNIDEGYSFKRRIINVTPYIIDISIVDIIEGKIFLTVLLQFILDY